MRRDEMNVYGCADGRQSRRLQPVHVNIVLGVNYAYATWERATQIRLARFATIGVQFDF